ncbi:sulfotransferase family 2 domain-containing protein [uncultured Psychromonas sp.]|uniref:sulfotransferase family 2 domain-containing protein n=1 Tax=uncultured Psychromonas sp. TaxID=173974 RepID=UPI002633502C|nr:sulfotransferase family 2 domain-containing protein [uncultured Psychromonas sp.]
MAIINNSKQFVFVHVPKAAGTSVTNVLAKYTTYKDLEIGGTHFGESIQPAYKNRFGLCKHSAASSIRNVIGQDTWDNMYKFSIVRNPYDRVISTYKFLLKWVGTPAPVKEKLESFKDINEYVLSSMWEDSEGPDFIFKPQVFWLTDINDRSKIIVDFIGKLETLDQDLASIQSVIEGDHVDVDITPQLNKTEGSYKLNERAIEKINIVYSRDFTLLGYKKIV